MTHSVASNSLVDAFQTEKIAQQIDRLRQLNQINVQAGWSVSLVDLPIAIATQATTWQDWAIAAPNARDQIDWEKGKQVLWLGQRFVVPTALENYPLTGMTLRLSLVWWAKFAQIFVNGKLVQEGDLFDAAARILLSSAVQPGEVIDVALRLVSPGHDRGALVRSRCLYEAVEPAPDEPGFVADELTGLQHYLTAFAPNRLEEMAAAVDRIDWSKLPDRVEFDRSLIALRQSLEPIGSGLKQRHIQLLGHAHLDLAWLWPVSETWEVSDRTFQSVLQLQQDFPELIFCHSTPALYAWIEQHRPELFAAIHQQIAAGKWEVVAGLWVEPDFNLVNGESIARQVLYGQRYVQEKFGQLSKIAWVPDSFGFCWQLPQILRQGGVEFFVTQKLRWNDTNPFPHELFWWRSPDQTQILSYSSAPIGEGIDPIKMIDYACEWEAKTNIPNALWLPGVGDHGGGPTRDMLEVARRWQQSPLFPQVEFTTAIDFLERIKHQALAAQTSHSPEPIASPLPVWDDELYLEFHRGCYTTHADQKRSNRRCQALLYQAELFASIATLTTGAAYPQSALESAWKQVLFNQFHDVLPGTSIAEVFVDANQAWEEAAQTAEQMLTAALETIAADIMLDVIPEPVSNGEAIVVFNPLNWQRSELVVVDLPADTKQSWQICDAEGRSLPTQLQVSALGRKMLFSATVPSVGYRVFWLRAASPAEPPLPVAALPPEWTLENQRLRVRVDPQTGDLSSVFDKIQQREVLSAPGNQLQSFQDSGQYWDAWNIDPAYVEHPLPPTELRSIAWIDQGPLYQRLRVVRQLGTSTFEQDYVLETASILETASVLKIITNVDWQDRHVLVKAVFPLNVESSFATYEIPFGAIARPTQTPDLKAIDPRAAAKWEVPALQWADLGAADYGVSLLNDCKHGYDSQPAQLRITLLRSPEMPDPNADRGHHHFTYALYPHAQNWQAAKTVRRGYELNQPLLVVRSGSIATDRPSSVKSNSIDQGKFLDLGSSNLVLSALKRSEDDPQQWILRCYESQGRAATFRLEGSLPLEVMNATDLLEQPISLEQPIGTSQSEFCEIAPWKIVTLSLKLRQPEALSVTEMP
jgi:alpha-mannosidase